MKLLEVMGKILSHAYLVSGFLPVQIVLPSLIFMLLGNLAGVDKEILLEAFLHYTSNTYCALIRKAQTLPTFSKQMEMELISLFSQFGCCSVLTPSNIHDMLHKAAVFEFLMKPAAALSSINAGIPRSHSSYWRGKGVSGIVALYNSQMVTARAVLAIMTTPIEPTNEQERVFSYLRRMIGNMHPF